MNEQAVDRGIKESGVDRKDIFLSTKLWPSEYENPNAVDEALERLISIKDFHLVNRNLIIRPSEMPIASFFCL